MSRYTPPGWIPYDPTNPLTFSTGYAQVKDLPPAERDAFVRAHYQEQEQLRRYLPEFRFVNRKRVTSIGEMTPLEREQWMRFLRDNDSEILGHIQGNDFFHPQEEDYYEGYNDELYIDTWEWRSPSGPVILTDIYGWPGDNQSGAVFIGREPVFTNSDTNLTLIEGSSWAPLLRDRMDSLTHLKSSLFCTEQCTEHEHCKVQYCEASKFEPQEEEFTPQSGLIVGSRVLNPTIGPLLPQMPSIPPVQTYSSAEALAWQLQNLRY